MPRSSKDTANRRATIRDVARKAKVSTATVSRVLAGLDVVSDELAERVRSVARSLKYQPSRVARTLRAGVVEQDEGFPRGHALALMALARKSSA